MTMITWFKESFAAPVFEDEDKTRAAGLVNTILLVILALTIVLPAITVFATPSETGITSASSAVMAAIVLGLLLLVRRGYVQAVGVLLTSAFLVAVTLSIYNYRGVRDLSVTGYFFVIALAGLLLGGRAVVVFGLACVLATLGVFYAEIGGAITVSIEDSPSLFQLILLVAMLGLVTLLLRFTVRSIAEGFGRARRNAQALAESNRELQASRDALQARTRDLERRAVQLQAAAEVARDAAATRELDDLLNRTVNLVQDRFGFYHAGIFLLDEDDEYAVLRAALSEGGQRMLAREHKLKVGEVGIVGHAASTGEPRIALDVGGDAVFFDNPDLPHTRSEMALPLKVRERVIGVLDVQSTEATAFDEGDVAVLQTMADQLAVAIQNAHLLQEMQQTVRELEVAHGRYTQEAWRVAARRPGRPQGYRYRGFGVEPVLEQPPEARQVWLEGRSTVTTIQPEAGSDGRDTLCALAMPIKLRDQVVGVLNLRFEGETVSSETVSLVEEVADRLALALENARLLEETRQRAERERLIGDITARVRASMDLEGILQTAVRELGVALGSDRAFIRLSAGPQLSEK